MILGDDFDNDLDSVLGYDWVIKNPLPSAIRTCLVYVSRRSVSALRDSVTKPSVSTLLAEVLRGGDLYTRHGRASQRDYLHTPV